MLRKILYRPLFVMMAVVLCMVLLVATVLATSAAKAAAQSNSQPSLQHVVDDATVTTSMVVVTLGDSRSVHGRWQQKLCQEMFTNANITCDLRNLAVGTTDCGYWASRISNVLTTHNPDMLILACGTNNNANTASGREQLGNAWRTIVEATYTFRTNPRVIMVPVLIQYSDPIAAPQALQWVITSEPLVNDTIYSNSLYYSPYGWFPAGFIDWQLIPNSPPYLEDPLHPSLRGQDYMGKLAYMEMAADIGWPEPIDPITCDLFGGRYPYGRNQGPGSQPCLQTGQ